MIFQIIFTKADKETIFKELKDLDIKMPEIEKFQNELNTIHSITKSYKGIDLKVVNMGDMTTSMNISIHSNNLFGRLVSLTKKFIVKFFVVFKMMIKEFEDECESFSDIKVDLEEVSTSLNGHIVPSYFVDMSYEERRSHVLQQLLTAAKNNTQIEYNLRCMAASLKDKNIDELVTTFDKMSTNDRS